MRVEVALPLPIDRSFSYRLPEGNAASGTRVLVPFGRRRLVGWVVDASGDEGPGELRDVIRVLDPEPSASPELLNLCRWVADYYVAPLGQVLRAALPAPLSRANERGGGARTRRAVRLVRELPSLLRRDEVFHRAPRQRACYEMLERLGGFAELAQMERLGFAGSLLRGLEAKGLVRTELAESPRDPFAGVAPTRPDALRLNPAQREAVARLTAAAGAGSPQRPFLLWGVTGSGKTQVYIELLKHVLLGEKRGAIVLVPEIALTPQTVDRFRAHFGERVAVLHSGLSDGERLDEWRALRAGRKMLAIGARSAVFAPVQRLGAVILDEEHETTYKQSDLDPRYHAREVAIVRCKRAGALCLLGSATPSLETWHNAGTGKFTVLELPERIGGRPLPPVRIVDQRAPVDRPDNRARGSRPAGGRGGEGRAATSPDPVPILSESLAEAMADRLRRKEQIILLLNRRGYSRFVQCRNCGEVRHCAECNVTVTYHRGRRRLLCHYCSREEQPPAACWACGSPALSFRGVGTEQVERAVAETFPAAAIARMDVDTTGGKWAHHRILQRFGAGEVEILLGTQMIAKGLDFPGVTLVGIIDADVGINLPDFRASERSFQLMTQVAGRAGRGDAGGEVLVQTALPEHYVVRAALDHDYRGFADRELAERAGPGYPPHLRLANVVVSGESESDVRTAALAAAERAGALVRESASRAVRLTGPAPCPIDRIRGRWRWHFLLRGPSAAELGKLLHRLAAEHGIRPGPARIRLIIDRDPVALL